VAQDGPPVSATTTSGLVPGVNTVTFNVDNCYPAAGQNPTGLDFVASITYSGGGGGGGGGEGGGGGGGGPNGALPAMPATFGESSPLDAQLPGPSGGATVSSLTATINWGDGSITSGGVAAAPGGGLEVTGVHTYWVPGTLPIRITISGPSGTSSYTGTAQVASIYTGLGDSYSSGEGSGWPPGHRPALTGCGFPLYNDPAGSPANTDYIAASTHGPEHCVTPPLYKTGDVCHRSVTAYAHVVERELAAAAGMTLQFAACSGAVIEDAYRAANQVHDDYVHLGERAQVTRLSKRTSLVTFTFGGNNLKFADIAKDCVIAFDDSECLKYDRRILGILGYGTNPGSREDGVFLPFSSTTGRWTQTRSAATMSLDSLYKWTLGTAGDSKSRDGNDAHDALVLLYRKVKAQTPGARILVVGYPRFFPPGGWGADCEHFSDREQQWINDRIALADDVIRDAAAESGVAQYVDVYRALGDHQECQGDHAYNVDSTGVVSSCGGAFINGVAVGSGIRGTAENLHPNPCGHLGEGRLVEASYRKPQGTAFTVQAGHSQTLSYHVARGASRLTVSATWSADRNVSFTLTGPDRRSHGAIQTGPVYSVWDVPAPRAVSGDSRSPTTLDPEGSFAAGSPHPLPMPSRLCRRAARRKWSTRAAAFSCATAPSKHPLTLPAAARSQASPGSTTEAAGNPTFGVPSTTR
jgi:hypothetical protein